MSMSTRKIQNSFFFCAYAYAFVKRVISENSTKQIGGFAAVLSCSCACTDALVKTSLRRLNFDYDVAVGRN